MATIQSIMDYHTDPAHTMCFSGHRPKNLGFRFPNNGYRAESYKSVTQDFIHDLMDLAVSHNITKFITGGAQGVDQLCFWWVEEMKKAYPNYPIQNIVFIPFPGQEQHWIANGLFSQQHYHQMLETADAVYAVHKQSNPDYRTACVWLNDRNKAMVNASSVCLFPERPDEPVGSRPGGTTNCYHYAKSQGIDIARFVYDITDCDIMCKHVINP